MLPLRGGPAEQARLTSGRAALAARSIGGLCGRTLSFGLGMSLEEVILRHASGHASFGNAKAMELAGVTIDSEDPPGGEIVRDREGHPIRPRGCTR